MENQKQYAAPQLIDYGHIQQITGQAKGKGPAALDGAQAQPNSKLPAGPDGLGGISLS